MMASSTASGAASAGPEAQPCHRLIPRQVSASASALASALPWAWASALAAAAVAVAGVAARKSAAVAASASGAASGCPEVRASRPPSLPPCPHRAFWAGAGAWAGRAAAPRGEGTPCCLSRGASGYFHHPRGVESKSVACPGAAAVVAVVRAWLTRVPPRGPGRSETCSGGRRPPRRRPSRRQQGGDPTALVYFDLKGAVTTNVTLMNVVEM